MSWGEIKQEEKVEVKSENLFKALKDEVKDSGLNILVYGDFGTGKSHFALSGKAPVYIIDTEKGTRPLLKNFKDKEVFVLNVFGSTPKETYENILNALKTLSTLNDEGKVGTVVFDSITDLWEVCQTYAKEEIWKIKDTDRLKSQWDWGIINKLYYKILKQFLLMSCNFVATARIAEVYAGAGQPTGTYKPKCQKETEYWVNIVIRMVSKISQGSFKFSGVIEKCKEDGKLQGKSLENISFDKLTELLIEEEK